MGKSKKGIRDRMYLIADEDSNPIGYTFTMAPMLPDDQLKELHALAKENNRMLKDMRRDAFIKSVFAVIWWIIILVVIPYFTWLYLEPYVKTITEAYSNVQTQSQEANDALKQLQELGNNFNFQELLDRFTGGNASTTGE
jgi:hypothetical protein